MLVKIYNNVVLLIYIKVVSLMFSFKQCILNINIAKYIIFNNAFFKIKI